MRIVIAEQWSILRSGLRTVLTQGGHAVLAAAATSAEALEAVARATQPELVLVGALDAPTPAFLHELAEARPEVRAIVLVDHPDRPAVDALLQAGAAGVLDQLTEGPALLDAVARIHRGERVLAPRVVDLLVGVATGRRQDPAQHHRAVAAATEGPALTARELEILGCLRTGATNRDIARRLFIGEATVKSHLASAYAKLGVANRHQALVRAAQLGIITVTLPGPPTSTPAAAAG